jgi:hypothetical protein
MTLLPIYLGKYIASKLGSKTQMEQKNTSVLTHQYNSTGNDVIQSDRKKHISIIKETNLSPGKIGLRCL